jgi:hypothetical protein
MTQQELDGVIMPDETVLQLRPAILDDPDDVTIYPHSDSELCRCRDHPSFYTLWLQVKDDHSVLVKTPVRSVQIFHDGSFVIDVAKDNSNV